MFLGEYSYMGTKADEFDATMRYVLTKNTPVILASFTAEVSYAVDKMIGECPVSRLPRLETSSSWAVGR